MKNLIMLLVLLFVALAAPAQKAVKLDSAGNYVSLNARKDTAIVKTTGKYFIDSKGVKYAVCESVNGKLYYWKTAKSGNMYRVYLKL